MRIENGVLKKVFKKDVVKWVCVIPDGVTSIGDWAFYGCTSLSEIKLPDGVTSIGNGAFPSWVKVIRG